MATTYTVKKGDTLSEIAVTYKTTVNKLVELNNIKDPDFIVIGQVLIISGTANKKTSNNTSTARIDVFGLQADTDRTVYATWTWSKSNTEEYKVMWYYYTENKVWFVGSNTTVTDNQSVYTAPQNATHVKFKVKPISKTRTVNNKTTSYWTAGWSTQKTYNFSNNPPVTPPVPTVNIEKYTLTAKLENLDVNASEIQFNVVKNNKTSFKTGTAKITTSYASYSCTVDAGGEYKVRCRSRRDGMYSDWSDYSANVTTVPAATEGITNCRATSETSVYLEWAKVNSAETYEIQYTTKLDYFDDSDKVQSVTGIKSTKYEKTGLESGEEYFFRVRSVNKNGESAWCEVKSIIIGTKPIAPTTWSSTTTVVTGEPLTLYWVHNSEDESSQTFAEVEMYIDDTKYVYTVENSTDENEKDKTSSYVIDTLPYDEGVKIRWRVRTAGITMTYGEWSIERTVDIYAPPTVELNIVDINGENIEVLETFPFYVSALAGPNTQVPTGYYLTVVANEAYEAVDSIGNVSMVNNGDTVYAKYFDTDEALLVEFSANNIDLENNVSYTITCTASMNSGLTAESSLDFTVAWTDMEYEPNAEISIDGESYYASIRPYCEDEDGNLIPDITLSVYRREFDGSFTELATGIDNVSNTFITDPHPSLDYARYRIVAITNSTGAVSYCDIPGIPVVCDAAIIQWDESWNNFDVTDEDELEEPVWTGSMLKLPYNIDVSDKSSADVALIEYIGREHPVSYYGTQTGFSSTWNMDIAKDDDETLYMLRRLQRWMSDVYVREPSGSGYWANMTVSFSQKHREMTIPVTLTLVRVEGGV